MPVLSVRWRTQGALACRIGKRRTTVRGALIFANTALNGAARCPGAYGSARMSHYADDPGEPPTMT